MRPAKHTDHTNDESKATEHREATGVVADRALIVAPPPDAGSALALQAAAGNRAARQMIQAKLEVGAAGDRYEQEADRIADQVVARLAQRQPVEEEEEMLQASHLDTAQRQPVEEEEEPLQASSEVGLEGGPVSADTETAIRQAKGRGKPLDDGLRSSMEQAFGTDFSDVRVHADHHSTELNHKIQAKAFTTGSDIFVRSGDYDPASTKGQRLLAHELTHVVQQRGTTPTPPVAQRIFGRKGKNKGSDEDDDRASLLENAEEEQMDPALMSAVQAVVEVGPDEIKAIAQAIAKYEKTSQSDEFNPRAHQTGMSAVAELSANGRLAQQGADLIEGITYLMEAGFVAGGTLEATGQVEQTFGDGLIGVALAGQLKLFAGAAGSAKGKLTMSLFEGFSAELGVEASVGVRGTAKGEMTISLASLGVDWYSVLEAEGFAGAEVKAEGKLSVGPDGIVASGMAEAFAGVRAGLKGKTTFRFRGREVVTLSGGVEASAGVGGRVGGEFKLERGKLTVGADLAAALGIGGGASLALSIDFEALARGIVESIQQAMEGNNPYRGLVEPEDIYSAFAQKLLKLKKQRATKELESKHLEKIITDVGKKKKRGSKYIDHPDFVDEAMAAIEVLLGVGEEEGKWLNHFDLSTDGSIVAFAAKPVSER